MGAQRNRFVRNTNWMKEMRSNKETGGEDKEKNNGTQENSEIKSEGNHGRGEPEMPSKEKQTQFVNSSVSIEGLPS